MSNARVLERNIVDFIDIISEVEYTRASDACYMEPRLNSSCGRAPQVIGKNIPINVVGTPLDGRGLVGT